MAQKTKKKNNVALYIIYGLITIAILVIFLTANDIGEIFSVLGTADVNYVWICIALLLIYAALYPLTTCILTKSRGCDISFGKTYSIAMIEHFFNGITPFSTGGQPFEVYEFKKAGVKAADSTGILLMNFIIMMIVTNAFALCSLIYFRRFVTTTSMLVIAIVGFTMNFLVLILMISLATSKKLRNALFSLANFFCRFKWIKKLVEPSLESFGEYLDNAQAAFKELVSKKGVFVSCLLVRAVTMAVYYAMTFFILKALHIDVGYNELFFVMCGSSFAITAVVFVPTPGSSGGIEFAFSSVFTSLAGGAVTSSVAYGGMLIWRLLSYYLMMAISFLFYLGLEIDLANKRRKNNHQLSEEESADCAQAESAAQDGQNQQNIAVDAENSPSGEET